MDAAMSAAGRSRPGSRRTSMLGGATPSMRPVGRDTPRSRLHNQLNTPGMYDSAPIIPDFDLVGPKSSWDGESVATTRAGSTRPPPHPHTTPRHAMQATVEDAPPSGFTSARPSPLHSGAIIESKRNSDMETVHEEPVAGPSAFPHVVLSVDPPEGDPSRSRPSSRRAGSSGRTRDEQLHQDSGWDDFDTHAPATSGWDDFGGGDGWPGGFNVGGHAGGSGWPDEPPPLASGLGLSGATASQQGSRRPSDASLYVQDPILPQTPARSRAHSRAPSGSGLSQMARSPPGGTAPLLAPPQVRSPTLSDVHGANMFHVPVAGSPPLGSPSHQVASPPRPHPIRTNITPTRSNATPSRSVRPTPIARDYALPEGHRNIPLAADGTPRFPQHKIPVPAGVSTPGRALREAMFMGNGTPRHPAAARQAQPEPEPEPEPEPPQEPPQEDEPAAPGKKSFLSRVSSMLNRDRNIQKDKPPAPRKVKKKKGKGAVEEMLAEEWAPEAGPSTLGDAPPLAEHDPADEERKRAEEEEARRKAEEDERRRKEEAEEALKAAEEAARLESERRRQEEEERRLRDEEEERLARERAEAVEAEHAQVLSQHGDAPPPDPPSAAVDEQADKGEGGGGGWGIFKRRGTKKKKGPQKPPTPPPPEPSPFNLPPLPAAAAAADAPPPPASVPPSPQGTFAAPPPPRTFAAPPPPRTFAVPPSPIRPLQQSPRPTLDTTVHGHAPTLIEFSGAPHEEHREYVYVPSNATPTPAHRRGASTIHAVPAPATRRSPTHVYAGTAATQTPRLPSTYTMPFPHSHGPGRSPLPRVASGASGAMAFRVPPRSPTGTTTAPATPSVPSAQLLAEHTKVLGALEGAEAARDRAFLQNEERRARLFDEAEDRRRQEAEARRRVIEVWV